MTDSRPIAPVSQPVDADIDGVLPQVLYTVHHYDTHRFWGVFCCGIAVFFKRDNIGYIVKYRFNPAWGYHRLCIAYTNTLQA